MWKIHETINTTQEVHNYIREEKESNNGYKIGYIEVLGQKQLDILEVNHGSCRPEPKCVTLDRGLCHLCKFFLTNKSGIDRIIQTI